MLFVCCLNTIKYNFLKTTVTIEDTRFLYSLAGEDDESVRIGGYVYLYR